jgi:PmbA protein
MASGAMTTGAMTTGAMTTGAMTAANNGAMTRPRDAPTTLARQTEHETLALCESVMRRALAKGAAQAEVWGEHAVSTNASLEQNELKGAATAEHAAFGVRVIVGAGANARVGFCYVNRKDDASLDEAIDDALAIARASGADVGNDLVEPRPVRAVGGLYDSRVVALSADDAVGLAARMLSAARDIDARVSIDSGYVAVAHGTVAIATSKGIRLADTDSSVMWGLFGMAVDGDDVGSFENVSEAVRDFACIDVEKSGREFAQRALSLLRPRAGTTSVGPAIFSPEAFEEIFLGALSSGIDGDAVRKGKSRLKDKLGARIAARGFTLVDDGTIAGGNGSAPFDREGLPHRRTVIVGDGVLHHFIYDGRTAKRAGRPPTGHASGSARNLPGIGLTNVRLAPGTLSDDELLRTLGKGLLVGRFSGNVDEVSGDFSGVAKASFAVKNGRKAYPVQETLIAGNVFDLLPRVVERGATLQRLVAVDCPHVLVDGLKVTANG